MYTVKRLARPATAVFAAAALAVAGIFALNTPSAEAVPPPDIPSAETAQTELESLTVAEEQNEGYDRDLFPHWSDVGDGCTARQHVLHRDGSDVESGSDCQPTSGSWQSDFDDTWTEDVSNATIDHVVALSEAWGSGARDWSTAEREAFANDIDSPQLWIASTSANSSKGDKDPAEWMPTNTDVHCDYVKAWIHVKYLYDLSIDSAEADALESHLSSAC